MGKAMYLDDISNDAIKCGIHVLEAPLLHLYNQVLNSGCVPYIWSDGLIIPLHKKNDKLCIDNHRGLIICSCFGKLFTKIITKKMINWCELMDYGNLINVALRQTTEPKTTTSFKISFMRSISIWKTNKTVYTAFFFTFQNSLIKSIENSYYTSYLDTWLEMYTIL